MRFLYVSRIPMYAGASTAMVMNIVIHWVQRHPSAITTKPPTRGPSAGPRKGVATYKLIGTARVAGIQMSDIVAEPMLSEGEPNNPAKNRHITSVATFCAKPEPIMKRAKIGMDVR